MIEATSCGGVVIYRGKILALYKSYKNRYEGWVLPKGTVEAGETHMQTALREVQEEAGVTCVPLSSTSARAIIISQFRRTWSQRKYTGI